MLWTPPLVSTSSATLRVPEDPPGPQKESSFLPIRNRIAYRPRRTLNQARSSQRRESDMSSGRSLDLLLYQLHDVPAPVGALRRLGAARPNGRRIAGNRGLTNIAAKITSMIQVSVSNRNAGLRNTCTLARLADYGRVSSVVAPRGRGPKGLWLTGQLS